MWAWQIWENDPFKLKYTVCVCRIVQKKIKSSWIQNRDDSRWTKLETNGTVCHGTHSTSLDVRRKRCHSHSINYAHVLFWVLVVYTGLCPISSLYSGHLKYTCIFKMNKKDKNSHVAAHIHLSARMQYGLKCFTIAFKFLPWPFENMDEKWDKRKCVYCVTTQVTFSPTW